MLSSLGRADLQCLQFETNAMISNRNRAELKNGLNPIFSAKVLVLIAIKMPILAPLASGAA